MTYVVVSHVFVLMCFAQCSNAKGFKTLPHGTHSQKSSLIPIWHVVNNPSCHLAMDTCPSSPKKSHHLLKNLINWYFKTAAKRKEYFFWRRNVTQIICMNQEQWDIERKNRTMAPWLPINNGSKLRNSNLWTSDLAVIGQLKKKQKR